MYAMVPTEEL
jgi:hypothetical protein